MKNTIYNYVNPQLTKTQLIQLIKNSGSHYFDAASMRFFNQKVRDFKLKRLSEYTYELAAPSFWDGKYMGTSVIVFNVLELKTMTTTSRQEARYEK